jgi:hypothetical protein
MNALKGKKTYLTVAAAFAYLVAAKFGLLEFDQKIVDGLLAVAIGFLRVGVGNGNDNSTPTV